MSSENDERRDGDRDEPTYVGDPYETRPAPPEEGTAPPADRATGEADDGGYPRPPTFVESGDWSNPSYAESPSDTEPPPWQQPQWQQPPAEWQQPPAEWQQPPVGSEWQQPPAESQWEQPPAEAQWQQPQWQQPPAESPWEQPQAEQPTSGQPQWGQLPTGYAEADSGDQHGWAPSSEPATGSSPEFPAESSPAEESGPTHAAPPWPPAGQQPVPPPAAAPSQSGLPADLPPQPPPGAPVAAPVGYAGAYPPDRQPRPEDLLVVTATDSAAAPASWGWRGRLNRASGGLIKAKAAPAEVAAREAIKRIQRSFSRPMTVVVVQPKGGAGKTPTTICLSAAFGAHRGGYVVGWDDNETRGTLAVRVRNPDNQQATVWDLLSDLDAFERSDARVGDLSYYVRAQPDAYFDALVSDDNPGNMAQIGDAEFNRLHRVLQRFYRMIVIDTGNNVRSANWQAAVNAADLVVVVSTYQRDVGFSASWVLDHLAQTGREELARNAVTVLTAADPTSDKQVREELLQHFSQRTRAVVEIPYDQELAHGGPISWLAMQPATRNAWVEAGATVADALSEIEQRALQARRA